MIESTSWTRYQLNGMISRVPPDIQNIVREKTSGVSSLAAVSNIIESERFNYLGKHLDILT